MDDEFRDFYDTTWMLLRLQEYFVKSRISSKVSRQDLFGEHGISDLSSEYTELGAIEERLKQLPCIRPLTVIPATTIPFSYHPHRKQLCLETGLLNSDVWYHILSSLDRATLRSLRLCNISFAIIIHDMPPETIGYKFCT